MEEERYNEIDTMTEEELNSLSEEEYREYSSIRYLKLSDQKTALESLKAQIETAQQGYLDVWKTGFKLLDEKLDGGFLGGNLILMGAISSLGKTTFALQIADQIAAQGKDVLIFSLEMSKNELNAKSISRNTFNLTTSYTFDGKGNQTDKLVEKKRAEYRLTMSDILRGRVGALGDNKRKLFEEAFKETQKLSEHIFIIRDNEMDSNKIADTIQAHIDVRQQKPFVIIDYLQILKAREEARTNDKRLLTDDDVNRLKDIAVKKDLPIFVISSFNRNSYLEPVSMSSFKESGTIEFSSDTLIGLQYSGMQYQKHWYRKKGGKAKQVYESKLEHDTRVRQLAEAMDKDGANGLFLPIDVVLLKNRGVSKGKLLFEFCPKYNIFREKVDQNDILFGWNREADEDEENPDNPFTDIHDSKSPKTTGKGSLGKV